MQKALTQQPLAVLGCSIRARGWYRLGGIRPASPPLPRPVDVARCRVGAEKREKNDRWIRRDEEHADHDHDHHPEGHAASDMETLSTVERRARDHRQARVDSEAEREPRHPDFLDMELVVDREPDKTSDQRG